MPVELPIAFDDTRPLLTGRQTLTHRAVTWKGRPVRNVWGIRFGAWRADVDVRVESVPVRCSYAPTLPQLLWVREPLRRDVRKDADVALYRNGQPVLVCDACGEALTDPRGHDGCAPLRRREVPYTWSDDELPAIACPRWASRITIKAVDVYPMRIQQVTDADVDAAGFDSLASFRGWWDAQNAERGFPFACNPWAFAITFTRIAP